MKGNKDTFFNRKSIVIRHSIVKLIAPKLYEEFLYGRFDQSFTFTIPQLFFLCECVGRVRNVDGIIAEIGANEGRTTIFINKYLDAEEIEKKYYAIDTFSGFTQKDIDYEVKNRQKDPLLYTGFKATKEAFDIAMNRNKINRVVSIQADVNEFDFTSLGNICFALLDVDLYRPMKKSLQELYKALTPGGLIIVDDCDNEDMSWDGSYQAYKEFMMEINQPIQIVLGKFGIISKGNQAL